MSTPLSALGRITWSYSVTGFTHKVRAYCKGIVASGGSFNIDSRTSPGSIVWSDAAVAFKNAITEMMGTAYAAGQLLLEQRSGSIWTVVAAQGVTSDTRSRTSLLATELTSVFRDTGFHKVKLVVLEGVEAPPAHSDDPNAGSAELDLMHKQFLPTYDDPAAPYLWMVGRSNLFLNTSPFVSYTVTLNRKIRRRRGLA